ncbi:MAG: biopolymer transport protein ExbD [Rhodothermales bacterium]
MIFSRKKRDAPEIDVGAFSDIAFLLIIFFILTTTFEKFVGNTVEIPAGQQGEASEDKQTTVVLTADRIHFNDEASTISIAELQLKLNALDLGAKDDSMQKMVLVEATETVAYDTYFNVINAIGVAGGVLAIMETEDE